MVHNRIMFEVLGRLRQFSNQGCDEFRSALVREIRVGNSLGPDGPGNEDARVVGKHRQVDLNHLKARELVVINDLMSGRIFAVRGRVRIFDFGRPG